jgi:hypothetical protein
MRIARNPKHPAGNRIRNDGLCFGRSGKLLVRTDSRDKFLTTTSGHFSARVNLRLKGTYGVDRNPKFYAAENVRVGPVEAVKIFEKGSHALFENPSQGYDSPLLLRLKLGGTVVSGTSRNGIPVWSR